MINQRSGRVPALTIEVNKVLVVIAMFAPYACGISTSISNIISLFELLILLQLFNTDEFWVLTPVLYIFFPQLVLVGESISLYNVYCILCLIKLFKEVRTIKIQGNQSILIMYLLIVYAAAVCFFWRSLWEAVILFLQASALLCAVLCTKDRPYIKKDIQVVLIITCINATIYGVVYGNIIGDYELSSEIIQYNVRYAGTSGDPNYMAFFYCIAICYLLFMKGVKSTYKILGFIALFAATALTGSLTALVTILIILILYVLFDKEGSRTTKTVSILFAICAVVFFVVYITTDFFTIRILDTYKMRILERFLYISQGRGVNDITSGRTNIQLKYIEYLFAQNPLRMILGGYQINTQGLEGEPINLILDAPHNTYIDVLMTCGLLGLTLFVAAITWNIRHYWTSWRNGDEEALTSLIYMLASAVFIFGLSVFPGTNYMYFLML